MRRKTTERCPTLSPAKRARRWFGILIVAGFVLATPSLVRADPEAVVVTVKTIAEDLTQGRLVSLSMSDGAVLETTDTSLKRIPVDQLVRLTTAVSAAAQTRRPFAFSLPNGDLLYGNIVAAEDDAIVIETSDLGRISIPLEWIERVDSAKAEQQTYRQSVQWLDRTGGSDQDRVLLTNGDCVRGFITSLDANGVAIESTFGETVIPHRLVVAVRLASTHTPAPPQLHMVITLKTGGRLTLSDLQWSDGRVEIRLLDGQRVRVEAERITSVEVVGGRWEWLAAHRPISYEHTPMLSLGWEYAANRNVLGGPLTVDGQIFKHGIGVHSRSNLTYDLRGAYREFVTLLGIDDDSGPFADVSVSILVDGQHRFEIKNVQRGRLHGPVRIDTRRAKRVELIVDFGENGDLQDRFNWIETALIR